MLKIAICGSAKDKLPDTFIKKSREIGKILAESNVAVFTGATTGYSCEAAKGASLSGGLTVGISPAENHKEHTEIYKLPIDIYKIIIFTGHGYKARDVVLIRSVDAVIFIGGGTGTICELCVAIDNEKIIGILDGSGGATTLFDKIADVSHRHKPQFIYEKNPQLLVRKVIRAVCERRKNELQARGSRI